MIIIEYCDGGEAVSDFVCGNWLYKVLHVPTDPAFYDHVFQVSTSLPIYLVRRAIATGKLSHQLVTFLFGDHKFQANRYGAIMGWPMGFCDMEIHVAEDILRAAMKLRKEERTLDNKAQRSDQDRKSVV